MRGDEDRALGEGTISGRELPDDGGAAVGAEIDVHEGQVRRRLAGPGDRLRPVRGHADDADALLPQQRGCNPAKLRTVVDDEGRQRR
jgi:hypothetical protein